MADAPDEGRTYRSGYVAREVLSILNVKPHVLRYWEQSLPLIRPRRNESGHRVWSAVQVRMLLRLRHLIVRRGMSVGAAGDALIYEADERHADTKAQLESLRAQLLSALAAVRLAAVRRAATIEAADDQTGAPAHVRRSVGREEGGERPPAAAEQTAEDRPDGSRTARGLRSFSVAESPRSAGSGPASASGSCASAAIQVAGLIDSGVIPTRVGGTTRSSRLAAVAGIPDRFHIQPTNRPQPGGEPRAQAIDAEEGTGTGWMLMPIPQLFFPKLDDESACRLGALLRLRLRRCDRPPASVVVPIPPNAGPNVASKLGGLERELPVRHLSLPRFRLQSTEWWSPWTALLLSLAADRSVERLGLDTHGETAWLAAVDDPAIPLRPPARFLAAAVESATGLAVAVQSDRPRREPISAVAVHMPTWRTTWQMVVGAGAWAFVPGGTRRAGSRMGTWRYDVTLQDLIGAGAASVTLPAHSTPAPWRDASWRRELEVLWPELIPEIDHGGGENGGSR
jgi:DNA-binding transcriptional MerR regulator